MRPGTQKYKTARTGLGLFLLLFTHFISNANYNLNFADPNSFSITCGKLTSWWSVKEDSCMLYTSFLRVEVDSSVLTCNFRLNQSGNLDLGQDHAYIQYQLNSGAWETDTSISGYGLSAVWFRTFPLTLHYGDYVRFRVIYETNDNTEFWALQNGDINISGNFNVYPTEPSPMPVEFITLEAIYSENMVIINWVTASETNNDYFTVERSENGIDFYALGYIEGSGNSNNAIDYQFIDNTVADGLCFYRIKQTDYDGNFSYSETVALSISMNSETMFVYSENGELQINITSAKEYNAVVKIYEITGKLAIDGVYRIYEGDNLIKISTNSLYGNICIVNVITSSEQLLTAKCLLK